MKDISNFGNNLRDEIIEYRLEHETGYVIKPKFVDKDDKTYVCFSLYSKSGDLLSDSEPPVLFDPAGQRVIDDVKLIRGSDEGHDAEYEIKVTFKGSRDPIYCPVDDILMTAQNISMIADAESEEAEPTPVFVADVKNKKVTVYDLDVKNSININKAKIDALEVTGDIKADGISITAGGQLKIGNTVLNEATLTKLIEFAKSLPETESK